MNDFKKLKAPIETTKHAYKGWYVCIEHKRGSASAWLTTTGQVTSSKDNMSILFFLTELEALEASFKYYHRHGKVYPYAHGTIVIGTMDINESQVMEFE